MLPYFKNDDTIKVNKFENKKTDNDSMMKHILERPIDNKLDPTHHLNNKLSDDVSVKNY